MVVSSRVRWATGALLVVDLVDRRLLTGGLLAVALTGG